MSSEKAPKQKSEASGVHEIWRDSDEQTINTTSKFDKLSSLLVFLKDHGGSDLHISSNNRAMIRIRGEMRWVNYTITNKEVEGLIAPYMTEKQQTELKTKQSCDFSFSRPGIGVFRVNVFYQRYGLGFVLRYLPERPPTLDQLKLPSIIKRSCYTDNGLILVTGPTGSGKSTTLAATIDEINRNIRGHIITIEDPIEFLHESKRCMVNQRSLGEHFTDFASALRSSLREDPDVILVGEMRDRETMAAAIRAAETGHLVLSTLHTNSASKSVDRILNSFPADEQEEIRMVLSESLRLVVSQKLLPNKDHTKLHLFQDILVNTHGIANLIREGKTFLIENAMQTGQNEGMVLMDKALRDAAEEGAIRMADAHEAANDKRILEESRAFLRNESGIVETVRVARDAFGSVPQANESSDIRIHETVESSNIGRDVLGIKDVVADLKPGYKRPEEVDTHKTEKNRVPVHIKKIK